MKLSLEVLQSHRKFVELLLKDSQQVAAANPPVTTQVTIPVYQAHQLNVAYNTMPGNQPNTYGNYLVLWQNYNSIPWNTEPLYSQNISTNTPSSSLVFGNVNLTNNSYILGYSVGPLLSGGNKQPQGNLCATAYIPPIGQSSGSEIFAPSITVSYVGTDSVAVNYRLPDGILPMTNGAWIGIWESGQPAYNITPKSSNNIQSDTASGSAFINNIPIARGSTYTIALFMSGWGGGGSASNNQRPMACSVTFTNTNSSLTEALGVVG